MAFGVAMSALAADRHWDATKVGGSEDSPYDIWATANWDGAVGSGNQLHFAVSEKTYIKSTSNTQVGNDFDVDSGDFVFIGPLYFLCYKSNQANATSSVVKKGDWTIQDYGMRIGSGSGTTVTFTNESGNVSITGGRNNDSILSVAATISAPFGSATEKTGAGTVTLAAGTTLEVAESGTASVSNLTFAAGATLAFNFTDKRTAPVLAATSATLPATVNVKVSSANGLRAKGGRYALTSGGVFTGANVTLVPGYPDWVKGVSIVDGEIVLNVKPSGMIILVR